MKSKSIIYPRYQETDKMGVIHHSVYPVWFEVGRTDFCTQINMPYHEIEKRNIGIAVLTVHVEYKNPTYYGDKLTLLTYVKEVSKLRLKFGYELYNQHEKLVTTGYTEHVWLDSNFKPINITREHQDIFDLLINAIE